MKPAMLCGTLSVVTIPDVTMAEWLAMEHGSANTIARQVAARTGIRLVRVAMQTSILTCRSIRRRWPGGAPTSGRPSSGS
ncbi:hypothetical protein F4553_008023 [Allocatelliglobosispora scoriae]|uniref:Uncharacterized protein n=1 Tax=Allocatelliglobosispora scoriae TaxID=643052 RepID=A0A841C5M0_9ACTN|nr:hypothetical protein [Allocatelliglobosispora scoriae]